MPTKKTTKKAVSKAVEAPTAHPEYEKAAYVDTYIPAPKKAPNVVVRQSGHLGDCIYSLCAIRNVAKELGPVDLVICDSENVVGAFIPLAPLILEIIKKQPYIGSVTLSNYSPCDIDLTDFRRHSLNRTATLAEAHLKEAERVTGKVFDHDSSPWLTGIEPHSYSPERVVISRSHRYRNPYFPWKELVNQLGEKMLFVGTRDEHKDFENYFGWVEHYITKDLYEVAELIQGAEMFIGNQSSPMAIAMGLGAKIIQETSPLVPDCLFKRDNVTYITTGEFNLHGVAYGENTVDVDSIRISEVPPGHWQWNGEKHVNPDDLARHFCRKDKDLDFKSLRKKIIIANVNRCKDFFLRGQVVDTSPWKDAFLNAGLQIPQELTK